MSKMKGYCVNETCCIMSKMNSATFLAVFVDRTSNTKFLYLFLLCHWGRFIAWEKTRNPTLHHHKHCIGHQSRLSSSWLYLDFSLWLFHSAQQALSTGQFNLSSIGTSSLSTIHIATSKDFLLSASTKTNGILKCPWVSCLQIKGCRSEPNFCHESKIILECNWIQTIRFVCASISIFS